MFRYLLIVTLSLFFSSASVHAEVKNINYFELFNEHNSIMLIIDVETGKIEFSNIAAQKFYGYPKEKLESMTIQEINTLTPEEIEQERIAAFEEERNHFIFKHRLASGEVRTVEVFTSPYNLGNQAVLFSVIYDITPAVQLAEEKSALEFYYNLVLLILVAILSMLSIKLYSSIGKYKKEQRLLLESERKNKILISNIQGMIYRRKDDGYWTMDYVSDGCHGLTGYLSDELLNNAVIDFNSIIVEDFREILRGKWESAIEQESTFEQEYSIIAKDGTKKWVLERGIAIYLNGGKSIVIEGIITDITNLKTSEEKTREYYEKLYATLISVGDGVITTDREGKIELINPITQNITGWSQEDAFGEDFETVFNSINAYTREKTECPVAKSFETKNTVNLAGHTLLISKDGKETPIEDSASPILDKAGNIIGAVVIFRDNTEKNEKTKAMEYISYHDFQTGLYNRRFFEEELKRLDYKRNYPLSVIQLDVNGLKIFNDSFGHKIGDKLLKKVSEVLVETCRQDEIIARYGGDEFILLLPKTNEAGAEDLANRIKQAIEKEKIMGLQVSVSLGWDTKHDESQNISQIINNAENYMYQKKSVENLSNRNLVIKSILNTLLVKNPREEKHSKRVSNLCEQIGRAYNLSSDEVRNLKAAGELHDIGKIAIDDSILNKTGKLTEDEWKEIKKHPETGYRILSTTFEYSIISESIRAHHEKWDGSGYPKGLKGEEIPFEARVIAIADAYDAMTCDRPYHKAFNKENAIKELKRNAGTQFEPAIVKVFIEKVLFYE